MKQKISLRARAITILARQEISRAELARKLRPHVGEGDNLEALLDELEQRHWQSDARYTETYINSKSRLHGNLRLQQSLKQKGVDAELIVDYLPDKDTQINNAVIVLQKKYRKPPADLKEKHKYMHFLAYRGFSMDIIHAAIQQAWTDIFLPDEDEYWQ
ncbi:recombination regulator RecX [Snodgrassella communis]|uniref:recombination regulator RecX n=1 Tax=Snodgrassella communis TaxID=2946699 RepID=UPI001EF43605|nr:recombination regulator RecX [Snodgrassella communis]